MEAFLKKLEEYNIFNYLLPGIIFVYLLKFYVGIDIFQPNIIEMFFIYYFMGSVISRIGSIVLESFLKKIGLIKYCPYNDYLDASKKDELVEKLSMANNMYRTLCSTFITLIILKLVKIIIENFKFSNNVIFTILIIMGIIIYLFSYKKQTKYVVDRVEYIKNK